MLAGTLRTENRVARGARGARLANKATPPIPRSDELTEFPNLFVKYFLQ